MAFRSYGRALLWALVLVLALPAAGWAEEPDDFTYTRIEGDTLYVCEGVTVMGDAILGYEPIPGTDDYREIVAPVDDDDICCNLDWGMGDREWLEGQRVRRIVLPDSLRVLGGEAMVILEAEELFLSPGIRYVGAGAFYVVTLGRMVIPAGYDCEIPDGEYSTIGAYVVEEGNPRYRSIDGVLFSADGKTLLRYPNGRKATHYDVPRGVTEIADRAFQDDQAELALQTISLPIGLRRIGEYAFADCVRLQSLTVPLTVTDLAPNAFACCVSLERLSLPPGLSAALDTRSVEPENFSHYTGDNGATGESREPDSPDSVWYPARVVPADGVSPVPYYAAADDTEPAGWMDAGTGVNIERAASGRGGDRQYDWQSMQGIWKWFDFDVLRSDPQEPLFRVTDGRPLAGTVSTDDGAAVSSDLCMFSGIDGEAGTADFYYPDEDAEDEVGVKGLPIRECRLYREADGRRAGLIMPAGESGVAWLYDAPGGAAAVPCYPCDQARVLQEENGWLRVRTAYAEGWLNGADFCEVWPEEE